MPTRVLLVLSTLVALSIPTVRPEQSPKLRISLVKQPFVPNGTSTGPTTMASGGIQDALKAMGAEVRVQEIKLSADQEPEYGGWKRLGFALGHLGRAVAANEKEGWFTVGLLGTCPSMPGMVAGFQRSSPRRSARRHGGRAADRSAGAARAGSVGD